MLVQATARAQGQVAARLGAPVVVTIREADPVRVLALILVADTTQAEDTGHALAMALAVAMELETAMDAAPPLTRAVINCPFIHILVN